MLSATALPKTNATTAYGLLNAIARIITEEPKRLAMEIVCYRGSALERRIAYGLFEAPACGTVGCIAGWALTLAGETAEHEDNSGSWRSARYVLGLSDKQALELFAPDDLMYQTHQTPRLAQDTVAHIRAFQKANQAQLQATKLADTLPRVGY